MKVRVHTYMVVAGSDEVLGVAVIADATVETRVRCAFVNVVGAIVPTVPTRTFARVAVVSVDARDGAPGAARVRGAFVHVLHTRGSSESRSTQALVVVDAIYTVCAVAAWVGRAEVGVGVAGGS